MNTENTGSVDLPSLQDDRTQGGAAASRDMLSNIVVEVSIVIGKTKMPLQEIMNLSRGATVGVDTLVGEPSGLYVNNRKFAEVEVVVIDEHFGFRITRILPGGVASED